MPTLLTRAMWAISLDVAPPPGSEPVIQWVPLATLGAAVLAAIAAVTSAVLAFRGAGRTAAAASLSALVTNCMTLLQSADPDTRAEGRAGLESLADTKLTPQQAKVAAAILGVRLASVKQALEHGAEIELEEEEEHPQPPYTLREEEDTEGEGQPEGTA